jgi:hypothetical protein
VRKSWARNWRKRSSRGKRFGDAAAAIHKGKEGRTMKKTLIPAFLVISAAFSPCQRNAVEFPDRVCEVVQEVARPLFWHLWDRMLTREVAQGTGRSARNESSIWQAALHQDAVVCIFFHIILKHAFDRSLSVAKENSSSSLSISTAFIRRTVEREFLPFQEHLAS